MLGAIAVGVGLYIKPQFSKPGAGLASGVPLPGAAAPERPRLSGPSPTRGTERARTNSKPNEEAVAELVNRGSELLARGKPDEAMATLEEARRKSPNDEDVHYNLGIALARQSKLEEAAREYQEALRIFPD